MQIEMKLDYKNCDNIIDYGHIRMNKKNKGRRSDRIVSRGRRRERQREKGNGGA